MSEEAILPADEGQEPAEELDLEKLTTDELLALVRAAESRVNVFAQLNRGEPERYQEALEEATADMQKYADALKDHNYFPTGDMIDPTKTVPDKEGTAPTLADGTGTFAEDAVVANIGGIGINDSNANPEGALQKLKEMAEAGQGYTPRGTSPLMGADTTTAARREAEQQQNGSTERVQLEEPV